MPKQFIQVKRNENINSNMYSCEEKQDCAKYESSSNISNSNGDICRICHCESDLDNPLLSPCYCSGSLKYVHQSCLRQWLAASDTRSCELCKFNFILHTKIKPLSEWRRLEMTGVERRRLSCAILFHFVAAICVIWSLFVLIDRATEEVQKGLIAWPFWTKLVVVAVGFTGGAVFMYIQCRQYLHLFSRWKAHNRIILVQNAPEKAPVAPSTSYTFNQSSCQQFPSQIVARVEYNNMPSSYDNSNNDFHLCYVFHQGNKEKNGESGNDASNASTVHKADIEVEDLCDKDVELGVPTSDTENQVSREDNGDRTRREILALDIECFSSKSPNVSIDHKMKTDIKKNNAVFISLPNLSASSENLLV